MVNKKGVNMLEQVIKNGLDRIQRDVEEIKKILVDVRGCLQDIESNTHK